jgi:hypothetical protein
MFDSGPVADFSRSADWQRDPKHVLFVLARYKFVAKMFSGKGRVLEVGAGDGFASELVRREVQELVCTDAEPISEKVRKHDIMGGALPGFDCAFALDVYEHISPSRAPLFLANMSNSAPVVMIGTPSLESQVYASPQSKAGHVNCRTQAQLRTSMGVWFRHVFMFGQNDEIVHTGFPSMCHYLWALGIK